MRQNALRGAEFLKCLRGDSYLDSQQKRRVKRIRSGNLGDKCIKIEKKRKQQHYRAIKIFPECHGLRDPLC